MNNAEFFEDYPTMNGFSYITTSAAESVKKLLSALWWLIQRAWYLVGLFTIIVFIISLVRISIHSDDSPMLRDRAKHDLETSIIALGIIGAFGGIVRIILLLLNF